MKKYILFILAITAFGVSVQLKAGHPVNNPNDDDPDSSKHKNTTMIYVDGQDINIGNITVRKSGRSKEVKERNPDRIEQKTFSNISDVELDHKYGNVIMKESNAKDVTVEIQYFDLKNQKAECEIVAKNKVLIISTSDVKQNRNNRTKINYIINLPKNTGLSVLLKYGNMKAGKISGTFDAKLSYSNLDVETIATAKSSINLRYGKVSIGEAQNLFASLRYSELVMRKAKTINLSGNYNKIDIKEINDLILTNSSAYNSYSIGKISTFNAKMKYDNVKIDDLGSSLDVSCAYTNIKVKVNSPKVKNVKVSGSYSDIEINLNTDISASFDSQIKYGDLIISKAHKVKYTEETTVSHSSRKKGQIGGKNPNTSIIVSNTYSDIKIK